MESKLAKNCLLKNPNMRPAKEKRGRGRPQLDLAIRLRNWGWYSMIKAESKLSDDALDARYVPGRGTERPRMFFRIRAGGSSPSELMGYHKGKTIFESVHEGGEFQQARSWFESGIWQLLSKPDFSATERAELIQSMLRKWGLYRASPAEIHVGKAVLGDDEPLFETGLTEAYQKAMRYIAVSGSAPAIALLCALYREAHDEFETQIAAALEKGINDAVHAYLKEIPIQKAFKRCFEVLISERILRNRWITESDMPPSNQKATRPQEIRQFFHWYISSGRNDPPHLKAKMPVVWHTQRVYWYRQNRIKIYELWNSLPPAEWDPEFSPMNEWVEDTRVLSPKESDERFDRFVAFCKREMENQEQRKSRVRGLEGIPPREENPKLLIEDTEYLRAIWGDQK